MLILILRGLAYCKSQGFHLEMLPNTNQGVSVA